MTAKPRKRSPRARADDLALDARLDKALDETFPASDPIAVHSPTATEPPGRPIDRKAALPDRATEAANEPASRRRRTRA